jgi:hypothetical protein
VGRKRNYSFEKQTLENSELKTPVSTEKKGLPESLEKVYLKPQPRITTGGSDFLCSTVSSRETKPERLQP